MKKQPVAFLSYVRSDDKHEEGRITEFRKRLSNEVQTQTGEEFPIFQDRKDIQWGQNWSERIEDSLDEVTFLIPIITPGFFRSAPCRKEMEAFLEREKRLKRNDLILPLYYVDSPLLNHETKRAADMLAQIIASRQRADWRDLRFKSYTSPQVRRMLAELAVQIRDALERTAASTAVMQEETSSVTVRAEAVSQTMQEVGRTAPKTEPPTRVVDPMHRGD